MYKQLTATLLVHVAVRPSFPSLFNRSPDFQVCCLPAGEISKEDTLYYVASLLELLETPHRRQIATIIQCLGHVARPSRAYLSPEKSYLVLRRILSASKLISEKSDADYSAILPDLVTALAHTLSVEVGEVSEEMRDLILTPALFLVEVS